MLRTFIVFLASAMLLWGQWTTKEGPNHARERQLWFYGQRAYPSGSIPPGARRDAFVQMKRDDAALRAQRQARREPLTANQAFAITTDSQKWTLIGPHPSDPKASPTSGRVGAIAIDPRDANVLYIG